MNEPDRSIVDPVERRLRAGAASFGPQPSPELRARILAELRSSSAPDPLPVSARLVRARTRGLLAAATLAAVLGAGWWFTRVVAPTRPESAEVLVLSRGILAAGTRFLALPAQAESNLRLEAENLLTDTTRAAQAVLRGLPAPLRARLESM